MPHLVLLTVDNPPEAQRWLVPGPRPDDRPGHGAADGRVAAAGERLGRQSGARGPAAHWQRLFFSGSGNDAERHAALQYATAVWHYPAAAYSQPPTPVDLFCCGHAFLPNGRLLASGGTEKYDDFFGLKQAVTFDPHGGPPDPASPSGFVGAWIAEADMVGRRWYPTLVPLQDGRVLAVSGLDGTSQLNRLPEMYSDGAGSVARPAVTVQLAVVLPPVPARGRPGVLQRRAYGGNNGVRPEHLGTGDEHRRRRRRRSHRGREAQPVRERPAAAGASPAGHADRRWAVGYA